MSPSSTFFLSPSHLLYTTNLLSAILCQFSVNLHPPSHLQLSPHLLLPNFQVSYVLHIFSGTDQQKTTQHSMSSAHSALIIHYAVLKQTLLSFTCSMRLGFRWNLNFTLDVIQYLIHSLMMTLEKTHCIDIPSCWCHHAGVIKICVKTEEKSINLHPLRHITPNHMYFSDLRISSLYIKSPI